MLTQRSEGLRRLLLFCQIWITAGLFWVGVWVMVRFYSPGGELTWRRYSIYCVLLVLGLTLEYLGRDSSRDYPLQTDLLREHRVSLRQTVASIGTLVIYLIATKDGFISRVFLFNFVPCFYLALLFSHHYLPVVADRGDCATSVTPAGGNSISGTVIRRRDSNRFRCKIKLGWLPPFI